MTAIRYVNFNSLINPSFWHKLTQLKLDVDKLDETERRIWGMLNFTDAVQQPYVEIDSTSFNDNYDLQLLHIPLQGKILNKNTIEQFKECEKNNLMQQEADLLTEKLRNDDCINNPSLLNAFFVLSFADLKKYQYYYWFAFPAPLDLSLPVIESDDLKTRFTEDQLTYICKSFCTLPAEQKALFIVKSTGDILMLSDALATDTLDETTCFGFTDASHAEAAYICTFKNIIALLTQNDKLKHLIGKVISFIALRVTRQDTALSIATSKVFKVQIPESCGDSGWVGWERNVRGKFGPRMCNMKSAMDPKHLAETSVDLNLKLMKWRLLPDIDLGRIKSMKCLLLGSGTLGCSVARVLLGWGVRNIDFVDNSTVSHSNPVRQSLFKFEDAVKSLPKAEAAANNLKEIFPGVLANGHTLNVLMPGHPIGASLMAQAHEHFTQLNGFIQHADIVFLLMDSRESRWLPTLLAQHHGKLVINAALGFDTYLVMRHGVRHAEGKPAAEFKSIDGYTMISGDQLGCYFCNDVTAPGNSLKERTLDRQCTVARPGVSQIASALAVELAVSLMQHPHGALAPAYCKKFDKNAASRGDTAASAAFDAELEDCRLGLLPHSIRGFLSNYTQVLPATQRYKQCIACSEPVLGKYQAEGFEFLLSVFESSKVLEDLTGLTEIYNVGDGESWDFSESESAFDDEADD